MVAILVIFSLKNGCSVINPIVLWAVLSRLPRLVGRSPYLINFELFFR